MRVFDPSHRSGLLSRENDIERGRWLRPAGFTNATGRTVFNRLKTNRIQRPDSIPEPPNGTWAETPMLTIRSRFSCSWS
jgi:hypothetical protein